MAGTRDLKEFITEAEETTSEQPATADRSNSEADQRAKTENQSSKGAKPRKSSTPKDTSDNGSKSVSRQTSGQKRPGRPRVPKAGNTTRVTLDLAVTEAGQLETLAAKIGRQVGRSGKQKIWPQQLYRVAVRRLLTDSDFLERITEDLSEHCDELKRK